MDALLVLHVYRAWFGPKASILICLIDEADGPIQKASIPSKKSKRNEELELAFGTSKLSTISAIEEGDFDVFIYPEQHC